VLKFTLVSVVIFMPSTPDRNLLLMRINTCFLIGRFTAWLNKCRNVTFSRSLSFLH